MNQTEWQQTKMSRNMPKATSRLLILLILNVAFLLYFLHFLHFFWWNTEPLFLFFLNIGMSFQSWMPYRLYKGKCTKGRSILTRWVSGAGPAACFKAAGLEELASEHGQEFTKTKLPAPDPSYSHYICLLFPPTLLCFTAPWTKVTSTTDLCFVHSACLD